MKKFILSISCFLPLALCAQGDKFVLQGKVGNLDAPAKAYLTYNAGGENVADSATIVKGVFEFTGNLEGPTRGNLILSHDGTYNPASRVRPSDVLTLFLEPVKFSLSSTDSIKNASIQGSKVNDDNKKLNASLEPITKKNEALMTEYYALSDEERKSETLIKDFSARASALGNESKEIYLSFIKENPNSFISLTALNSYAGSTPNVEVVEPIFNTLSSQVKSTRDGKAFADRMTALKKVAIGAIAPEFSQADPDGKEIKLSDFRGKYLLIDFWAAWCGPCRQENPNVVAAYAKYKDKNFEILGVSLDQKKDDWLAAIEKDGLPWPQVSDLKYWNNEVSRLYSVRSIPQNFLLDPEGKIIATNLRGKKLEEKLEELLK